MPLFNPSSEKIKYLFIDGGALNSILSNFSDKLFQGMELELNYHRLANGYQKVFYYDCMPAKKKEDSEEEYSKKLELKTNFFNKLKSIEKFHVYEGTARYRDKNRGQEQKQVDIMIAVDMLMHSFRRNMHEATLLSSDLDFKPLIDALVQDGMHVSLWYQKGRTNHELVDAADSRLALTIDQVWQWTDDTFKQKISLPSQNRLKVFPGLPYGWNELKEEKIENNYFEAFFYQKDEEYRALVPIENQEFAMYEHNNLKQLKFYVDHSHAPNVRR